MELQLGVSIWDTSNKERTHLSLSNYGDLENDPSFLLLKLKVDISRLKFQEQAALNIEEKKKIIKQIIEKLIENLRFLHKPICKSIPKNDLISDIQRVEAEFRDYLRKRDDPNIIFHQRDIDLLYD